MSTPSVLRTSALCLIPPKHLTEFIQELRAGHDKAFSRWPVHGNLLFPFVSESYFPEAKQRLEKGFVESKLDLNFEVVLEKFASFPHGNIHLRPDAASQKRLEEIYQVVAKVFPEYAVLQPGHASSSGLNGECHFHVTVGQWPKCDLSNTVADLNANFVPIRFRFEGLSMIARSDEKNSVFQVKCTVGAPPLVVMEEKKEIQTNLQQFHVYPISSSSSDEKGAKFIGKFEFNENSQSFSPPHTIVILDSSGSMDAQKDYLGREISPDQVKRFVGEILPKVCKNLGYSDNDSVVLIRFASSSQLDVIPVKSLSTFPCRASGGTIMQPAILRLKEYVEKHLNKDGNNRVRILVFSDGEINDSSAVQSSAANLIHTLKTKNSINAQSVRLFTSNNQPDTRALTAVLQFNTQGIANVLDIELNQSTNDVAQRITALFSKDQLGQTSALVANNRFLQMNPWSSSSSSSQAYLQLGENVFFLSEIPDRLHLNLGSKLQPIEVKMHDEMDSGSFQSVLKSKISFFMNQVKVLKVVNTTASIEEIKNIVKFFKSLENRLVEEKTKEEPNSKGGSENALSRRLVQFRQSIDRDVRSISMQLSQLANNDKISTLNSAQQAEYLRSVDVSKNGKGLARRIDESGSDFLANVHREVEAMHAHLAELNDIDDSMHFTSFYSTASTLEGIKEVCRLVDENLLESSSVDTVMRLINIVGLGCRAQENGDYPDPMSYRIDELLIGTYVSLSDILQVKVMKGKNAQLFAPGLHKAIINVVPFFDDDRIHLFLRRYAPKTMEYAAGIGMRGILGEVPMTMSYTIAAGIWKLVEHLNENKSSVGIETFGKMIKTFQISVGTYFAHILEILTVWKLKEAESSKASFYLANNGITNLLNPLITILSSSSSKEEDPRKRCIPAILRALYTFEIWQAVRKCYTHEQNSKEIIADQLQRLLRFDVQKNAVKVQELFEKEPENPQHCSTYEIDANEIERHQASSWWVDYLTLLPSFIETVLHQKNYSTFQSLPSMDDNTISKALGLPENYSMKKFRFYNVVQAFLFTTKQDRVDDDNKKMKIVDLGDEKLAEKMVTDFVVEMHQAEYARNLKQKTETEAKEMARRFQEKLLASSTDEEIKSLFKDGITESKSGAKYVLVNVDSLGFAELKRSLLDCTIQVPQRCRKLTYLLMGRDETQENLYNNGNVLRTVNIPEFERAFAKEKNGEIIWGRVYRIYLKRMAHRYRGTAEQPAPNRHGHSNLKPSFYALGYRTKQLMRESISESEYNEYNRVHHNCCEN
jgi:hypothetical protein